MLRVRRIQFLYIYIYIQNVCDELIIFQDYKILIDFIDYKSKEILNKILYLKMHFTLVLQ